MVTFNIFVSVLVQIYEINLYSKTFNIMEVKIKILKWAGLFFAIILPVVTATSRLWTHNTNYDFTIWSYFLYILPFLILLAIIRFGEKESFSSLGLLKFNLKTLGNTILQLVVCLAVNFIILNVLNQMNVSSGPEPMYTKIQQFPTWGRILISFWAGFSEEFAYRGYAITRLQQLTGSKTAAILIPIILFGLGHAANGSLIHVIFSILIGFVFIAFYMKTKNLFANIFAHALLDFIFLVVLS
jgi:membrane protease YdiL (CAAX protease family)